MWISFDLEHGQLCKPIVCEVGPWISSGQTGTVSVVSLTIVKIFLSMIATHFEEQVPC